ncbi:MAG: hypothetical protein OC190_06205 [Novosphingobium aromaticivorans]|nr:hypothetical protein [Novosphingobium aromaticivorans]
MPAPIDPTYSRGKYSLGYVRRRDGTLRYPVIYIFWYDERTKRRERRSTGTVDVAAAEQALDRLYMERERGQAICATCGRPYDSTTGFPVVQSISDYLIAREAAPSFESIRPRLAHFLDFLGETGRDGLLCEQVDEVLIDAFRSWSSRQPVFLGGDKTPRQRALATTEATVRQLAAALNFSHRRKDTLYPAGFVALPASAVSETPTYRSSVKELAAMFAYCLHPRAPKGEEWSEKMVDRQRVWRGPLLRFLQISVATWCRPDAAHDFSTTPDRQQWLPAARVVRLNPKGRAQTKKYRPALPVPEKFARLLENRELGYWVGVASVRKAFEAMQTELGLPRDRETGLKLIRRSVSQIARPRIGEERWAQGQMMLGHRKASTSDIYALFDPLNLGLALSVTEAIMDEIEAVTPGAFTPAMVDLKLIIGGRRG